MNAKEWNASVPVESMVRYWPVKGSDESELTMTRSPAWDVPSGDTVVLIYNHVGGVDVGHLEPVDPKNVDPCEAYIVMVDSVLRAQEQAEKNGSALDPYVEGILLEALDVMWERVPESKRSHIQHHKTKLKG